MEVKPHGGYTLATWGDMADKLKLISAIAPFGLRMEAQLRDAIREAARASGRSLNAEIVHRLHESLALEYQQQTVRRSHSGVSERGMAYAPQLSEADRLLLKTFKELKPEAQLGLITFLRGLRPAKGQKGSK